MPVPVSTDNDHVVLRGDELAKHVALVRETLVCMVIVLVLPIRTHNWRRAYQYPERRIGFLHGAVPKNQPRLAAAIGRTVSLPQRTVR